jgi:DNA-binding transcriptional MerR regulator
MEAESMCEMSISQFAKEVGVSVETIRFYERRGLDQPASRKANGYRVYGPDEVRRVRLIRAGKAFTFTLRELEMNAASLGPTASFNAASCNAALRKTAQAKVNELDREIGRLQQVRSALKTALRRCSASKRCPCFTELATKPALDSKNKALRPKQSHAPRIGGDRCAGLS